MSGVMLLWYSDVACLFFFYFCVVFSCRGLFCMVFGCRVWVFLVVFY